MRSPAVPRARSPLRQSAHGTDGAPRPGGPGTVPRSGGVPGHDGASRSGGGVPAPGRAPGSGGFEGTPRPRPHRRDRCPARPRRLHRRERGSAQPHRPRRDRGSASLELLGILPLLMLVAMAGIQLGIAAYVGSQAGSAARSAARTASQGDRAETSPGEAGLQSMSGWLRDGSRIDTSDTGDGVRATATVDVPSIFPGFGFGAVSRDAEMPKD